MNPMNLEECLLIVDAVTEFHSSTPPVRLVFVVSGRQVFLGVLLVCLFAYVFSTVLCSDDA